MNSKPKHFFYIPIVAALLFFVWLFLIHPVINDISELKRKTVVIEKENYELEQRLSSIHETECDWEKWSEQLVNSEKMIPPVDNLNELFAELEAIFAKMPVRITGVSTGKMEDVLEEQHYAVVSFDVYARGAAYDKDDDLIDFMVELEKFPYLLIIKDFTMQYGEKKDEGNEDGTLVEVLPRLSLNFAIFINKQGLNRGTDSLYVPL